jgi:hypothetical protein
MMFLEIMERTCGQESKASALQTQAFQSSSNGSKCTQEIQKKAGFGKEEGDGKYVATVWKRGCGESGRLCAYIALPYRPRFEHGETGLHQEHEHRGIVDGLRKDEFL